MPLCADGTTEELECASVGCPAHVTSATCVGKGAFGREFASAYFLLHTTGRTSCSGRIGDYVGSWNDAGGALDCLYHRDDWMPSVECGDADSSSHPTTFTEEVLYADIIGVFKWSGQCRWLCQSNGCSISSGSYPIDYKCGDGKVLHGLEECDDGNNEDGDGCSAFCMTEGRRD